MPERTVSRPRVENVVAEALLGGPFDVASLSRAIQGAEYRPDRFIGLVLRVPDGSALVFEDGHVVTTGARSEEQALAQMQHVRELLADAGAETSDLAGFLVRNVVVSSDLRRAVRLKELRLAFPEEDMDLDPERFPGLVWRHRNPRMTVLVFPSGKLVATGSGDRDEVEAALTALAAAFEERHLLGG